MSDPVLEYRVTKLEETLDKALTAINDKLDEIVKRPICPNPGLCVQLQRDNARYENDLREAFRRIKDLEEMRDQAKGMGFGAKLTLTIFTALGGSAIVAGIILMIVKTIVPLLKP